MSYLRGRIMDGREEGKEQLWGEAEAQSSGLVSLTQEVKQQRSWKGYQQRTTRTTSWTCAACLLTTFKTCKSPVLDCRMHPPCSATRCPRL